MSRSFQATTCVSAALNHFCNTWEIKYANHNAMVMCDGLPGFHIRVRRNDIQFVNALDGNNQDGWTAASVG